MEEGGGVGVWVLLVLILNREKKAFIVLNTTKWGDFRILRKNQWPTILFWVKMLAH